MSTTNKKSTPKQQEASLKEGVVVYLKGVKSEWGKITWPERAQSVMQSFIVLGVVLFFTVVVYVFDKAFEAFFKILLMFVK